MNCITLRNPDAAAVVAGCRTELFFRGRTDDPLILIHAGQEYDRRAKLTRYPHAELRGRILGYIEVRGIEPATGTRHGKGMMRWRLGRAMTFIDPPAWCGELGVYEVPDAVFEDQIEKALPPAAARAKLYQPTADEIAMIHSPSRDGWTGD